MEAEGIAERDALRLGPFGERLKSLSCARVGRDEDRQGVRLANRHEAVEECAEPVGVVDVRLAVSRDEEVAAFGQP